MSEEKEKEKKKEQHKPLDVTPEARDQELANWMQRLFDGEFPAKLHVVELHGKSGVLARGEIHDREVFTNPRTPDKRIEKPKMEFFVGLSNRFIAAAQRDCDMRKKSQNYAVEAFNTLKGSGEETDPYTRYPLSLSPKSSYLVPLNGKGRQHIDDEDEDDENRDRFGSDKLLRRIDRIFVDFKQHNEMTFAAMGQMFMLYSETNAKQQEMIDKLMSRWIEATESKEKALSGQADRDLARDKQLFWLNQMKDGAVLVRGLLPQIINKVTGSQVMQGPSTEQMVLANFINSCTKEQVERAFGKYVEGSNPPEMLSAGVFTAQQAYIIENVATGKIEAHNIDLLIPGKSEHSFTPEQLMAAQQIFSDNQLKPIQLLISERMKKMQ